MKTRFKNFSFKNFSFKRFFIKITSLENISLKAILIVIAVSIWVVILQNAGVLPTNKDVEVVNEVNTRVKGTVDVEGSVDIDNQVDINVDAINGKKAFYDFGGDGNYVRIPVMTVYPSRY